MNESAVAGRLENLLLKARQVIKEEWSTLLSVTVGTAIICFALVALTVPYKFAGTGVTGIALITNYLWGISPAWVITIGNVLLLVWGWRELSTRFAAWTVYVTVLTSVMVPFFELFTYPVIPNPLLAALFCGVVGGAGFGMLFRVGACSGGTDVVVMVARRRWNMEVGTMSFYLNMVILLCSITVVSFEQLLLGALVLYVETWTIDNVVRSFHRRTQILVISPYHEQIASYVMDELDRSATLIPVTGAYSGREGRMLLIVLNRRQVALLKMFIARVDPSAFVVFSDVSEVVGEGFKSWGRD